MTPPHVPHVPHELLERFVAADLTPEEAVGVALHIDECSVCATRAAALDPLNAAFATSQIPDPPDDLVAAVLARAAEPDRSGMVEIGIGVGLLAAAAMLTVAIGGPLEPISGVHATAGALLAVGRGLVHAVGASEVALAGVSTLALVGVAATVRALSRLERGPFRRAE